LLAETEGTWRWWEKHDEGYCTTDNHDSLKHLRMITFWTLRFGGVWHHNTAEKEYVGGLSIQGEVGTDYVSLVEWEKQMNAYNYSIPFEWFYKYEEESMQELKPIRDESHLLQVVVDMEQRGIDSIHVFVKHEWNDAGLNEDAAQFNDDTVSFPRLYDIHIEAKDAAEVKET
ncbi:hypothetical protein Tsubulata_043258, partial [Turnera subulata]